MDILGDRILEWLEARSKLCVAFTSLGLIVLIAIADYKIHTQLTLALFYTLPVFASTGRLGAWAGFAVALLAAGIWLGCDLLTRDYGSLWWLICAYNTLARMGVFLFIILPFAALKLAHERERQLARHDSLTGLLNRMAYREALQAEIDRAKRYPESFTVLFADVDNLNLVNNWYGHAIGNKVLIALAESLKKTFKRSTDRVARLSGDEFAVLLPGQADVQPLLSIARKEFRSRIEQMQLPDTVDVSIGFAQFPKGKPPESIDQAMQLSDLAMYRVKEKRKGRTRSN